MRRFLPNGCRADQSRGGPWQEGGAATRRPPNESRPRTRGPCPGRGEGATNDCVRSAKSASVWSALTASCASVQSARVRIQSARVCVQSARVRVSVRVGGRLHCADPRRLVWCIAAGDRPSRLRRSSCVACLRAGGACQRPTLPTVPGAGSGLCCGFESRYPKIVENHTRWTGPCFSGHLCVCVLGPRL